MKRVVEMAGMVDHCDFVGNAFARGHVPAMPEIPSPESLRGEVVQRLRPALAQYGEPPVAPLSFR